MTAANNSRRNSSLWIGLILSSAAVLCNFVFFLNPPVQSSIPWLSLILAAAALVFLGLGVNHLFTQPRGIARRVFGTFAVLVALLFSAGSIFGFFHARAIPPSADAPQIGQKAPGFTLTDTNGRSVSLAQLFAPSPGDAPAVAPKAVLLVFYRGYW